MKQFLLLRSNKQSGPYSAEELKQMGLKPYDLIWVEGKSAAWRYPGEVEELKAFAPPVEEQPYDRFYKKSETAAKNQQPNSSNAESPVTQSETAPQQTHKPAPKKEKEYKRVFVTLPSNATVNNGPAATPAPNMPVEKPIAQVSEKKQEYSQYMPQEKPPAPQSEPTTPVNKQPQPEPVPVKKSPVFQERKTTEENILPEAYLPRKKTFRVKPLAVAALAIGMLAMIGLGIWIGLRIDKKDKGVSLIKNVDAVPANSNKNEGGLIGPTQNVNTSLTVPDSTMENVQVTATTKPKKPARVPVPSKPNLSTDSTKFIAANSADSGFVAKEELRVKKPVSKPTMPELEKLVSVKSNDYKVGPFGGISKLALTVTNSSDYTLNLVVVQVEYLKVNKEVFKTENLYFRDLAANSSLTLDAPRSNRGNSVNYKVTLINSKDHLFHAGN